MVKTKKGVFTVWYAAGICKNSGMWLVYDSSGIQTVWERLKILVYKLVYVEIWYESGM